MNSNKPGWFRLGVLGTLVFAYFVVFPEDVELLVTPFEGILQLSNVVSVGAYGVTVAVILCWTVVQVWGAGTKR